MNLLFLMNPFYAILKSNKTIDEEVDRDLFEYKFKVILIFKVSQGFQFAKLRHVNFQMLRVVSYTRIDFLSFARYQFVKKCHVDVQRYPSLQFAK